MNSPRIITSIPKEVYEKLHSIAKKKGLSVSSLSRVLLIQGLESIPADDSTMKTPGGMLHV